MDMSLRVMPRTIQAITTARPTRLSRPKAVFSTILKSIGQVNSQSGDGDRPTKVSLGSGSDSHGKGGEDLRGQREPHFDEANILSQGNEPLEWESESFSIKELSSVASSKDPLRASSRPLSERESFSEQETRTPSTTKETLPKTDASYLDPNESSVEEAKIRITDADVFSPLQSGRRHYSDLSSSLFPVHGSAEDLGSETSRISPPLSSPVTPPLEGADAASEPSKHFTGRLSGRNCLITGGTSGIGGSLMLGLDQAVLSWSCY